MHDIRQALRLFARNPGTTAAAVVSLALAIGPNSTLFSVVDRLFLRPAPVAAASNLYRVNLRSGDQYMGSFSQADYTNLRGHSTSFSDLIACSRGGMLLSLDTGREITPTNVVSDNYFPGLGIRALLGATTMRPDQAVMSYSLWQRHFAGDPAVIGRTILLNGRGVTVVGIVPREFRGLHGIVPTDIWMPLGGAPVSFGNRRVIELTARLRPGASPEAADAELTAFAARLPDLRPAASPWRGSLIPVAERGKVVLAVIVLSMVSLVLLIACANVAGLLLSQAEARRRETAIRTALGASRARLVRQSLTESLLLALGAGGLGVLFAHWLMSLLPAIQPALIFSIDYDLRLDSRVLFYTFSLSLATAVLFGLIPALRASRPDLVPALKGECGTRLRLRLRNLLVVSQIAVCQVLIAATGLLLVTYAEAQRIPLGFDSNKNLLFAMVLSPSRLNCAELTERLRAVPGVRNATWAANVPLSGVGGYGHRIAVPGGESSIEPPGNTIGPGYLATMGTRLLRGRELSPRDAGRAVLINETLARRLWPSLSDPGQAVGRWLRLDDADVHVAGIVENGKYGYVFEDPRPYLLMASPPTAGAATLILETAAMPKTIRDVIAAADPNASIVQIITSRQHMRMAMFLPATAAGVVGGLGLLGIVLAAVGLYGVVSYSVARRAHEFGVRVAVGARPRDVLRLVLGQGFKLALIGCVIGVAIALVLARVASSLLFQTAAASAAAILASAVVVIAVALAATHVPARRALSVDPVSVLRQE